jgi:hypothetical protein
MNTLGAGSTPRPGAKKKKTPKKQGGLSGTTVAACLVGIVAAYVLSQQPDASQPLSAAAVVPDEAAAAYPVDQAAATATGDAALPKKGAKTKAKAKAEEPPPAEQKTISEPPASDEDSAADAPAWPLSKEQMKALTSEGLDPRPTDRKGYDMLVGTLQHMGAARLSYAVAKHGAHPTAGPVYEDFLQRPSVAFIPGVDSAPWQEPGVVPVPALLEAAGVRDTMLEELAAFEAEGGAFELVEEVKWLYKQGSLSQLVLLDEMQEWTTVGLESFPRTVQLMRDMLSGKGGKALVSGMPPGGIRFAKFGPDTRSAPHCAPTNARLRIHYGLKVPAALSEKAAKAAAQTARTGGGDKGREKALPSPFRMRAGSQTRAWVAGRAMVCDDSYEVRPWPCDITVA